MRRSFLVGLIPAVAFAAVSLASTKEAHAGPYLGLDLDLGTAFQNRVAFSYGGGARFGYKWNIPRSYVWLLPEGGIHYMQMGTNTAGAGFGHALTVNGGARFGLQGIVQPNIFAHLGYGVLPIPGPSGSFAGTGGPVADIGAGLDFKITPIWTIGLQVAYNAITVVQSNNTLGAAKWVNFGVNTGFNFGEPPPRRVYYYR